MGLPMRTHPLQYPDDYSVDEFSLPTAMTFKTRGFAARARTFCAMASRLSSLRELDHMNQRHPFHTLLPGQTPTLYRRALKLTSNQHRAEDLVQDTLLKAWAKRESYRSDTNLRAWLFTIQRNTFFSDLRKFRREVQDVDGACARALYENPRQEHALALMELISAIALLPDAQRQPLVLMGAYGFTQLEAANTCDCTVGTIKSRVSRGRQSLSQSVARDMAA